ncbi:hypothetical protein GCM10010324_22050 [Streptomyces hiroshimensis]|uniref:Uncharacterized protein n=1 Tax=Streptomyces hiroshimensis TaxID=66424 RepID=A0ABQ2YAZ3_9ACTN|nr:hypothetical protein GCM10010324_22050 [Streptomyces hiroshimensis]
MTTTAAITYTATGVPLSYSASSAVAISGAGAPAATEENCAPIEAPEYRIRVANISEKKAAWGAYMAPWRTSPTVTAATSPPKLPESTSAKNGKAQSPTPAAPIRYTGRRPIRSERAPHAGMTAKCTAEPTSTALRAVCLASWVCSVA